MSAPARYFHWAFIQVELSWRGEIRERLCAAITSPKH
jgi:hypothetical protein